MKGKKNKRTINRRKFVGTTLKLATLGTLLMPLAEACNNKKSSNPVSPAQDTTKSKTANRGVKKIRKKWSHEGLVINTKTNVLHFPTSKVYHYYDEIKPNHLKEISRAEWNPLAENAPKLNRQQSGNILELMAMQNLKQGVNDEFLSAAADILSKAFTAACENSKGINSNTTNFRLHELMLQLVALNTGIPSASKWQAFSDRIKKPVSLRKRQQWMASETNFNERVKYILDRQTDYMNRLTERAKKYSFT